MKINILKKSLFSFFHEFSYFSLFLHFIYLCISSMYIFLINFCFSVFLSSGVFILSQTLILFFFPSLSQSAGISFSFSFSFSFSLYHCQSLYDITWCNSIFLISINCFFSTLLSVNHLFSVSLAQPLTVVHFIFATLFLSFFHSCYDMIIIIIVFVLIIIIF